jgi:hypothetical protein
MDIFRVTVKSWIHLFCLYILCLKEHRKKIYRQIKAEILKFMWVCGKCQFGQTIPLWLQNKEIIRFSLFLSFSDARKWKGNVTADRR